MFESNIAEKDLENPPSMEALIVLPVSISSLILSNIRTLASTAIPIVKIIPAIPGKVNVALNPAKTAKMNKIEKTNPTAAIDPLFL